MLGSPRSIALADPGADVDASGWEDVTNSYILVVDHDPTSRQLVVAALRDSGYSHIGAVQSDQEALERIQLGHPELIICNMNMETMSGFELCLALRADQTARSIPILAQTDSADPEQKVEAFASGATDLFARPYHTSELLFRVRILLERGRLIERLTAFRAHFAEDLWQAAGTQGALLPDPARLMALRESLPFEVASYYEASLGLGGDIWGIEPAGEQRVLVFNADFSGHGVSAAFNTVRLHSFIHANYRQHRTPAELLNVLNQFLCKVLPIGQFATMFCAILDFGAKTIEYASAAAPQQILRSAANQPFAVVGEPGFPLGMTPEATFETQTAPFESGAMLLLFSDALIETPPPPTSVFSTQKLCQFINTSQGGSTPQELCNAILMHLFDGISEKLEDDLTLIAAHYVQEGQQ